MKLKLNMQVMVIDFHAKNQVNICKHFGKKAGKLIPTDGLTGGQSANLKSPSASPVGN